MTDPPPAIRAFLDANVLFSAAIGGGVARIWELPNVSLVTSTYALAEAHNNLALAVAALEFDDQCLARLNDLASRTEITLHDPARPRPDAHALSDPDDVAILHGAIDSDCRYLITGDKKCFGPFFGKSLGGVTILRPAEFIQTVQASR